MHQPDALRIEVLSTAVRHDEFLLFLDYYDASKNFCEFSQRCMNAIRKQERKNLNTLTPVNSSKPFELSTTDYVSVMPQLHPTSTATSIALHQYVLFARTGLSYGTTKARSPFLLPWKYSGRSRSHTDKKLSATGSTYCEDSATLTNSIHAIVLTQTVLCWFAFLPQERMKMPLTLV